VGIVLSGGGAKGAAHIGVLKYMEEVGIPVSYVTGTSMGSILGGLYALGYNASELEALISEIDWPLYIAGKVERRYLSQRRRKIGNEVLLNIPYGKFTRRDEMEMSAMPLGAVEGDNLLNLFNCLSIGYLDSISFDSMPIPFACVATDLMTGKPKVLRGGEFGRAIRSSMSIPVFFSPVEWEGHLLADGGITNNLPVDICREMGADIIIGLEVATDLATNADDLRSIGCQLQQYLSIMTNRGLEEHRKQCRIYINPDVSGINMLDFNASAIADLVHRGYEAAKAHEEEFLKLKTELCGTGDGEWRTMNGQKRERARTLRPHDSLTIDYMELFGMDEDENRFMEKAVGDICGHRITLSEVEEMVHVLQGSGLFHSVNYKTIPTGEEGHYALKMDVTPELPYRLGVGLRYDSEESASILLHASWNALKLKGWNASIDLGLRYNLWVEAHLGWLIMGLGDLGVDLRTHKASFRCNNRDVAAMDMIERKLRLGITTVHIPTLELSFGISQDFNSREADYSSETLRAFATGLYIKSRTDTRDANAFATDGFLLDIEGNLRQPTDHLFHRGEPVITDVALSITGYISANSRLTFIPGFHCRGMWGYDGDELWYNNLAGGTIRGRYLNHQLPFVGMVNTIELGPLAFVYALETRYRIFEKTYLGLHANMLAHSSRSEIKRIATDGYVATHYLGFAASVGYNSALGPIEFMVGTNSRDRNIHGYINIGFEF
jgi:NTE family protein